MRKTLWLMASLFLLTACTTNTPTVVEPTLVTPTQTLQVTKTPFPTFTTTPKVETPTLTPISSELVDMDPAYFDGIVVITQYYTFLDEGLFEEAYTLLSSEQQKRQSLEEYTKMKAMAFKTVKILKIQPYYYFAQHQGWKAAQETGDERQFYIQIIAEGEGGMSGSYLNGVVQSLFLSLIQEKSSWKINGFGK